MKTLFALFALITTAPAADMFPFQLPWDDASESITNVSWLNDKPAGRDGFIHVKDGHLFAGEKRFRIFGVNVCFAGNFPTHEDATKIAARMAKFGINCVRFHHMDMFSAPNGIFAKDGKALDPVQLDKLDYFISELKKNGIYADLNLHVSRTYPDRPRAEKKGNPEFDKGVDNYHAPMIALQKDYARELLTHVNKYTGKSHAEEPAVALVEINNENALGFEWWAGHLDDLPEPYASDLAAQWTAWLKKKYGAFDKAVWPGGVKEGPEILNADRKFAWSFEQHGDASAKGNEKDGLITFDVEKAGTQAWHAQFLVAPIPIENDKVYEIRFRVRVTRGDAGKEPKDASISVTLMQANEPWKVLGNTSVKANAEWRDVSALIKTSGAEPTARLTIGGMGQVVGKYEFSGFSTRTAAVHDMPIMEGANARYVRKRELPRYKGAGERDWQEFVWDTEKAYWNGMRDFLKKELGVKAPIVGTQGFWSPAHVQAEMDVIDSHVYWQHPDFLGRGWNADVWSVKNIPMAGAKDGGTLPRLAAQRVAGKPFICTEYNHSAPNTYGAEAAPLLCAFAALQDWDGIFLFAYSHGDKWQQNHFDSFFDIARHPVKMATLPAAAVMFRRGDGAPQRYSVTWEIAQDQSIREALRAGPGFATQNTLFERFAFMTKLASKPSQGAGRILQTGSSPCDTLIWNQPTETAMTITERSLLFIGNLKPDVEAKPKDVRRDPAVARRIAERGGDLPLAVLIQLLPSATRRNFSSYQFTVFDRDEDRFFSAAKHILITATGDVENTEMGWKNAEKTTVGRDWGKPPVLVEGPAAKVTLPGGGKFKAWALDERGQRRDEIPINGGTLEIGPQYRTLWYEVERN